MDVMRTSEAIALVGRGTLRSQLRRGVWQQPERGVVVRHNGPLTRSQSIAVALAMCPPKAAVAGGTALELDGFTGFHAVRPHIVLPEGAKRPRSERAIYHWSTVMEDVDIHPHRAPRRTRPARSVVDQAAWSTQDRGARVTVLSAVQQGIVRPIDLREALARRGSCRWRAVIKESILDAAGGIHSLPERDFDAIIVSRGLPRPSRQRRIKRADGFAYLDVAWDELGAACEVHGMPHMAVHQWDADLDRANDVITTGPRLLAFSSFAIRHRPDRVAGQIAALLRRGGWLKT